MKQECILAGEFAYCATPPSVCHQTQKKLFSINDRHKNWHAKTEK